jgi:hypothetical protein
VELGRNASEIKKKGGIVSKKGTSLRKRDKNEVKRVEISCILPSGMIFRENYP